MLDRAKFTGKRLVATFGAFTPGQKAVTIVAVLALAVGGYFFATWASKPTYAPLFSNLASADASAIVEQLNAGGVPYELADGGGTIMVPKDQVYDLRLQMSGEGLPAGEDTGYALLDKQGVTTSEFMQHVSYQRALQSELANTIKSIDGVEAATVHLAIPAKDVFADDAAKPTASVLVKTRAGKELGDAQVQAIVNLVASSVEGLSTNDVTLADAEGTVLSTNGKTATAAGGDARSKQTAAFEQRMGTSIQTMLEQVVGPGHAVVKVTADLDYDEAETKTQTYTSDPNTAPLAETNKTETYTGTGTGTGGVLGPDNIQVPGGTNGNGTYQNESVTRNNAVNSVTETRRAAPGAVRRLNVAVLLDEKSAGAANTAQVQTLVQSAAGLDPTRGDTMAVTAMAFDESATEAAAKELEAARKAEERAELMSLVKTGAAIGVIGILMLLAALASRRSRKRHAKRMMLTPAERLQLDEMKAALERERLRELEGADNSGVMALEAGAPGSPEADWQARQEELVDLVDRQPEEVAQLLRGWLADRRETVR